MRILKNVIEIELENTPGFVHRDNVAGIRYYKNFPNNNRGEYIVAIHLIHPLNQQVFFTIGCNDTEPYIAWFNGYYIPEQSIVRDTCKCCNEQMDSVSPRPQFENKLLCDMCNDAKIHLELIDELDLAKPNITLPPSVAIAYGLYDLASIPMPKDTPDLTQHEKDVE